MKHFSHPFILIALFFALFGCKSESARQKDWIYGSFETEMWYCVSSDAVNESFNRLTDAFKSYSESRVNSYRSEVDRMMSNGNPYMRQLYSQIAGLQSALGEGNFISQDRREKKMLMKKYMNHCFHVDSLFSYAYGACLDSLKDCAITDIPAPVSPNQICEEMLGRPGKFPEPSLSRVVEISVANVSNVLNNIERPHISGCSQDKERTFWFVRMDGVEDQYVIFYKRDDGTYDIEAGEEMEKGKIEDPIISLSRVKI